MMTIGGRIVGRLDERNERNFTIKNRVVGLVLNKKSGENYENLYGIIGAVGSSGRVLNIT